MKLLVLKLLTIVIALTSLHINFASEISFNYEGVDSIFSSALLDVDTTQATSSKRQHEIEITPTDEVREAIFSLRESLEQISFLFYLPIYSLVRAKSYFLLI